MGSTDDRSGTTAIADQLSEPIAGVTLEAYARVSAGLADFGFDPRKGPELAARLGVSTAGWSEAVQGWNARIRSDADIAHEFNRLYTGQ